METLTLKSDGDAIPINHITVKSSFEPNNPQRSETTEVDSILNDIDQFITDGPYTKPACKIGTSLNGKLRIEGCDKVATTDPLKQVSKLESDVQENSPVHKDEEALLPDFKSVDDAQKITKHPSDNPSSLNISSTASSAPSPENDKVLPPVTTEPNASSPSHDCTGNLPPTDNPADMQQIISPVSNDNSTQDAQASTALQDLSKSRVYAAETISSVEVDSNCDNAKTPAEQAPKPLIHSDSAPGLAEKSTDSKLQTVDNCINVPSHIENGNGISSLERTPPDPPQLTNDTNTICVINTNGQTGAAAENTEATLSVQSESINNSGIATIQDTSSNSPFQTCVDSENVSEGECEGVAGQTSNSEIHLDSNLSMSDGTQNGSSKPNCLVSNLEVSCCERTASGDTQATGSINSVHITDGCETEKLDSLQCSSDTVRKDDIDRQEISRNDSFTDETPLNAEYDKVEGASSDCADQSFADSTGMEVDFNSSDNDVCGIQILESTSMASSGDLFTIEESETGTNKVFEAEKILCLAETNCDKEAQPKEDGATLVSNPGLSGDDQESNLEKNDPVNKKSNFVRGEDLKVKEVTDMKKSDNMNESGPIPTPDVKGDGIILIEEESDSGSKDTSGKLLPLNDSLSIKKDASLTSKSKHDLETEDVVKKIDQLVSKENHKVDNSIDISKERDSVVPKNGCKRSLSPESSTTAHKRSKLDEVESVKEGKGGIEPLIIDSDDDIILEEDVAAMDVKKKETTKKIKIVDADGNQKSALENKMHETNSITDVNTSNSVSTAEVKPTQLIDTKENMTDLKDVKASSNIHLSAQVLEAYITSRIKAFIKKQQQQQLEKLNKRITTMQSSTNLWEETAKHLEKSVKEVTILCKNLDKRRAHANACKKSSSRTVGVQVNDNKVKSMLSASQSQGNPANRGPNTNIYSPSLGPTLLMNSSQQAAQSPQQLAQLRQRTPQQAQQPQRVNQGALQAPQTTSPRRAALSSLATSSQDVNMIDLTDDDEVGKRAKPSGLPMGKRPVVAGGKTAPASMNGFIPLTPNSAPAMAQGGIRQQAPHISQQLALGRGAVRIPQPQGQTAALVGGLAGPRTPTLAAVSQAQNSKAITMHTLPPSLFIQQSRHPAPLPQSVETNPPNARALKLPPKPSLKISRVSNGIVLSWNMPPLAGVEVITFYQLFAYQETDSPPKTSLWKKVGDVRALPLPMACTLTEFQEGNKYHFAVRAVDKYMRNGAFSDPSSIFLGSSKSSIIH